MIPLEEVRQELGNRGPEPVRSQQEEAISLGETGSQLSRSERRLYPLVLKQRGSVSTRPPFFSPR